MVINQQKDILGQSYTGIKRRPPTGFRYSIGVYDQLTAGVLSFNHLIHITLRELCNISNTRKSVSSDIQPLRSRLKKRGAAEFF